MVRDTFVNQVCIQHKVSNPCDCGEHLNSIIKEKFAQGQEGFDPLNFGTSSNKTKVLAVMIAGKLLSLALTESIAKDEFDPLGSSICSEKKGETRKHL